MDGFFHQLLGSTFVFVKNTHQKAENLMFGLILPVELTPGQFLGGQYNQHEKEPEMKAETEKTTCLLDVAGKCSVKTSVLVLVKGIKDKSLFQEPVIKDDK